MGAKQLATKIDDKVKEALDSFCEERGLKIGRFVEDRSEIKSGRTYVLVTLNDGMVYKRVNNTIDLNNSLLLMSDNKTYNDYSVPIDEVLEIWEFTCCINTQEYSQEELKISSILGMFNELGVELKALEKSIK